MTAPDLKGKKVHAVMQGDVKNKGFYALIMNPEHDIMYKMTGKFKQVGTLIASVEKWAKENGAKEVSWDSKLKKR